MQERIISRYVITKLRLYKKSIIQQDFYSNMNINTDRARLKLMKFHFDSHPSQQCIYEYLKVTLLFLKPTANEHRLGQSRFWMHLKKHRPTFRQKNPSMQQLKIDG